MGLGMSMEARTITARPCRGAHIEERPAGSELVLFDPIGGRLHVLNPTAAAIWRLCDGSRSANEIAGTLGAEFQVGPEHTPGTDVHVLLGIFRDARLITESQQHRDSDRGPAIVEEAR
jgi:hypothetical protein